MKSGILDALFDLRFRRPAGPSIVRTVYAVTLALLTLALAGWVVVAAMFMDRSLRLSRNMVEMGTPWPEALFVNFEFWYGVIFLICLAPAYVWALMVNRFLAELALAIFRTADATERASTDSQSP